MASQNKKTKKTNFISKNRRWLWVGGLVVIFAAILGGWWAINSQASSAATEAPEAGKVLAVQANLPFQIMVPAYLPRSFDRAGVEIKVDKSGPGGEPIVQLAYSTKQDVKLYLRQWIPVNPDMEILANSRPIQTKWGRGWLLTQNGGLVALWVDIGATRVSVYTNNMDVLPKEDILAISESLGPPSNEQVFYFVVDAPVIQDMPVAPPVEIKTNDKGVQEVTLIVTPGGYSPMRFAVKKGVPVRLIFRQLGQVGCGNELIFPADPQNPSSLRLDSDQDQKVLEFTPHQDGDFQFFCAHRMYRGVMTVHD